MGDPVTLSLSSPSIDEMIELTTSVVGRAEADLWRSFRFRMPGRGTRSQETAEAFLRLIGRRGSYRLYFGDDEVVDVKVIAINRGTPIELWGRIDNISATGARIRIKGEVDRTLASVESIEIHFELPDRDSRFEMNASIRHRDAQEEGVAYGIRFESSDSRDLVEQQDEIAEHIITRRLEQDGC